MGIKRILAYNEAMSEIEQNIALYKNLYIKKGMTARKVAEKQNIAFDQNWAKALNRILPKNLGHGGSRPGSGNKKGVRLRKKNRTPPEE